VASKRLRHARHFLKTRFPALPDLQEIHNINGIEAAISDLQQQAGQRLAQAAQALQHATDVLAQEREQLTRWRRALALPQLADDEFDLPRDRLADRAIRFPIFLLATHYWEGRWLLNMEQLLPYLAKEKRKTGGKAVARR